MLGEVAGPKPAPSFFRNLVRATVHKTMSDALRKETANMELLEKEFSLLNLAESMPQIGEK